MKTVFQYVLMEVMMENVHAKPILLEISAMNVPPDFTTFRSVYLVNALARHQRMISVTQKADNAGVNHNMEIGIVGLVTMDIISIQIVHHVTVMRGDQLRRFATKMMAIVFAKKAMEEKDVIDVKK